MKKVLIASIVIFSVYFTACGNEKENQMHSKDNGDHKHTNHLINENSPYLLSHAHNPVNWYPWGKEALEKAKSEDKPIFLSIGYAACHWCHVMERESFENDTIAELLNEYFISIKVDREQRPDLDQIYMTFTTAMTGRGGWPMSIFMTPDLKPFFTGTYFPPEDRYGRPGFKSLLNQISTAFINDRQRIENSSESIFKELSRVMGTYSQGSAILGENLIEKGASALYANFDHSFGGFGGAPKFPHGTELSLFLRYYNKSKEKKYLQAAEKALMAMARGGIYDHLGGGFARYSTDAKWLVPHFEKMLYDNAILVPVYAEAYQISKNKYYLKVIRETLDFILREMTDKSGGFYSALDADSEGEEGKFYVWSYEEVVSVLGKEDSELFLKYYNITPSGNWEGHNILNLNLQSDIAKNESDLKDFDKYIESNKQLLLKERSKRIRPLTDDKILSSWNGLALSAFAIGYQVTQDEKYLDAALKNVKFVKKEMYQSGKLTHSYREGRHSDGEFLEDYSFYIRGLIDLYQSDNRGSNYEWLEFALELADRGTKLFMDKNGTLFLREDDQEDLIFRPKDENDGAIPAPGSFLISSLFELNRLTDDKKYLEWAEKGLGAISSQIQRAPNSMTSALHALDFYLNDKIEIVIVGKGKERDEMLKKIYQEYLPNRLIAMSEKGKDPLGLFEGRESKDGQPQAYLCVNSVCNLPVSKAADLSKQLGKL